MPSVLLVASEPIIPTHFELILNTATTTRPAYSEGVWSRLVGVGKNYFQKIRLRADPLLANCDCLCHKKVRKRHTLRSHTDINNIGCRTHKGSALTNYYRRSATTLIVVILDESFLFCENE